jgi:hypothetical protein
MRADQPKSGPIDQINPVSRAKTATRSEGTNLMQLCKIGVFVAGLLAGAMTVGQAFAEEKNIFLTSRSGGKVLIGHVDLRPANDGQDFKVTIAGERFIELYMEDRNFQCLAEEAWHYCYLRYVTSGHIAEGRYAELEHALLFVRKSKNDVDLNPFNGIYYKIAKNGAALTGKPHDVDLADVEAANSQKAGTPIKDEELHLGQPEDYLFPTLSIE